MVSVVLALLLVGAAANAIEEMGHEIPAFFANGRKLAWVVEVGSVLTRFGLTRLANQPASPKTVAPAAKAAYRVVGYSPKAYRAFADDSRAIRSYVTDAEDSPPDVPAEVLSHDNPGTLWNGVPAKKAERLWQEHQRALAALFGTHQQIEHSTHFIQVIQPAAVIAAIDRVLAGHPVRESPDGRGR